eukprot:707082-Rhodomonas_salina.1
MAVLTQAEGGADSVHAAVWSVEEEVGRWRERGRARMERAVAEREAVAGRWRRRHGEIEREVEGLREAVQGCEVEAARLAARAEEE